MGLKNLIKRNKSNNSAEIIQTGRSNSQPFSFIGGYSPASSGEFRLYEELREAVPIIDAAIYKLVRLIGNFEIKCDNKSVEQEMKQFFDSVNVNGNNHGIDNFISSYFENLLTYGTAVGEIVTSENGYFHGLYTADLRDVEIRKSKNGFDTEIYKSGLRNEKIQMPQFVFFSALNPDAGDVYGKSLLKGLPFVSSVLLKIYNTIGVNWDRVGNVRFAVTYKPSNDNMDKSFAKERAIQIANQWSEMQNSRDVKDFIAVGDVEIKVIGADNQILDSEIPVREMLEQIIAKTGLPPFILGFSWSTTERMSSQQSDILTSELDYYRKILEPIIIKIADTYLKLNGYSYKAKVEWDDIMLQDISELSKARLYNAQAEKIEKEIQEV